MHDNDFDTHNLPPCIFSVVALWILCGVAVLTVDGVFSIPPVWLALAAFLVLLPSLLVFHFRQAQIDRARRNAATEFAEEIAVAESQSRRQQPTRRPEPHISGWSAVLLLLIVGVVVALAFWAATGDHERKQISAGYGLVVIAGLCIAFMAVAFGPNFTPSNRLAAVGRRLTRVVTPVGRVVSAIDGILVFPVAETLGSSQPYMWLRYNMLAGVLAPMCLLGYWLPEPWGLVPISLGFVGAISVARRWAWVEADREVAMMNGHFSGPYIRIGFEQDLRDEAMLAFMSLFLLVPLALRQIQLWADAAGAPLFVLKSGERAGDIWVWLKFYGTELAKAVPFVDWAEVFHVEGDSPVLYDQNSSAQQIVFATRIMVDLVFLAALLQAIGITTRTAKQKEMFYRKDGTLDRLDPFVEPVEFRKLVFRYEGRWVTRGDRMQDFPVYNPTRLMELAHHPSEILRLVAKELQHRDGKFDPEDELLQYSSPKNRNPDSLKLLELILAVRLQGHGRDIEKLKVAREYLNQHAPMLEVRDAIVRLIADSPESDDRLRALMQVLSGDHRDRAKKVRDRAFEALIPDARKMDRRVIHVMREMAKQDGSKVLRDAATKVLIGIVGGPSGDLGETPPAGVPTLPTSEEVD